MPLDRVPEPAGLFVHRRRRTESGTPGLRVEGETCRLRRVARATEIIPTHTPGPSLPSAIRSPANNP